MTKKRILFLCTGNSARSQMAEALLRQKTGNRVDAFSAGTNPKGLNPLSVLVMSEMGIDISNQQSKDVALFANQQFDYVITVCDRAKESCPVFPGTKMIHWSLPDPLDLHSFREVRDDLSARIEAFLKVSLGET